MEPDIKKFDTLIVGAGFSGIYQLCSIVDRGYTAVLVEMGSDIGGTWYWNRYPGAMSDSGAPFYRFSQHDLEEFPAKNRFVGRDDIQSYLRYVIDKHKVQDRILLNTELKGAAFDEHLNVWRVETSQGLFEASYLVSAMGLLNKTNLPNIKGLQDFRGEMFHSARFPSSFDFAGKNVGIIGNGSTGVQIITALGKEGVCGNLTSFQRHPQYTVPNGDGPIPPQELEKLVGDWQGAWKRIFDSRMGFGFEESATLASSVDEVTRQRVFEEAWEKGGGLRFMFGTFADVVVDPTANEAAAAFIRNKIKQIVQNSSKAEALTPHDLFARRPLSDAGYYETFNNPWVDIVDLRKSPIDHITAEGIQTSDGKLHELDVLILATGFDAMDGSYRRVSIQGRQGRTLSEHWKNGTRSYLGSAVAGFPNLFMVLGPYGAFGNNIPIAETMVDFITAAISDAMPRPGQPGRTIEATQEAEDQWMTLCKSIADETLFTKLDAPTWVDGSNIPGKKRELQFFVGGIGAYRGILEDCKTSQPAWKGFSMS
jgi:cyclohexanone monooxygenase